MGRGKLNETAKSGEEGLGGKEKKLEEKKEIIFISQSKWGVERPAPKTD